MENLSELLARDLTQEPDETLVAGVLEAETTSDNAIKWSADLLTELKRRHSWSEIVALTGLKQTTLHNRVHGRASSRGDEAK